MAIIQSKEGEVRFGKRKNLEQEAKMIGNWYRDCIRMYGTDCIYCKHDVSIFENYDKICDKNRILQQAYGYDISPNYNLSANIITYMDVQNDIFQLNKFGLASDTEIDFIFDSMDFACALACKAGQFKEYKIKEKEIICEVPSNKDIDKFPFKIGVGYSEIFETDILSGKLSCELSGYQYNKRNSISCNPYEQSNAKLEFPANPYLYKSMQYHIKNDDYLQTFLMLDYIVKKVKTGENEYKSILKGKIHGGVLFYDINQVGKYLDKIHPEVGDIICIDFPDENNREKYEITDCYDKQLSRDGISPLLHKYIWKCRAKRYINMSEEIPAISDADNRVEEFQDYEQIVQDDVGEQVAFYQDAEDKAWGGYSPSEKRPHDKQVVDYEKPQEYTLLEGEELLNVMRFGCGSKLVTNGYDLIFVTKDGKAYKISDYEEIEQKACCESNLRWVKASDNCLTFVNIEGVGKVLACGGKITEEEAKKQKNLEDIFQKTYDDKYINKQGDNFIKFKNTKTVVFASETNLFVKFACDDEVKIII